MSQYAPAILVMETDVRPVTAGGNTPGWVSGSIAALGLSASVNCLFDLGPEWNQYTSVNFCISPIGPSSGLSNVAAFGSDSTTINTSRRLGFAAANTVNSSLTASMTVANGAVNMLVNPQGRFVFLQATNADGANALGATSKVTLTAFPV